MAALNGSRPADVPECTRVNALALASNVLPRFSLYPLKEEVQRINRGAICKRTFTLRIECHAAGTVAGTEPADSLVDGMLEHATRTLSGNPLGGLVNSSEETAVEWAIEAADLAYCAAIIDFVVEYQTLFNDQSQQ